MFFFMLLLMFAMIGCLFAVAGVWFPIPLVPIVEIGIQTTGLMLIWIGIGLYVSRSYSTGACVFIELPNPNKTICIHQGKSNAKFIVGKKEEPNRISARGKGYKGVRKFMNIKDTGQALNVAGHDVVISSQDVGHNLPLWVADLVDSWKTHWDVRNETEWEELYSELKNIKSHYDLEKIEFLKPILSDPVRKAELFSMDLDAIREMRELLFDGRVINVKNYLDWSESATPYDNESIIDADVSHKISQMRNFMHSPTGEWMKYIIAFAIIVIAGAVAYQMIT
ncbi:MAG: hypothetical protein DRN27_09970 [Thermoplasmata archaeon]|nr:MAG: hypothetical protein DRN27_09970 [Thermoplasmata archaeon]